MSKEEMRRRAMQAAALHQVLPARTISFYEVRGQAGINKAGVLPFTNELRKKKFYLMQPAASEGFDEPSKLQICKGTREIRQQGSWENYYPRAGQKYNKEDLEPMPVTALREGIEEIGLRMDNIKTLYEWGRVEFSSARTGQPKSLWLYLAEVKDAEAFDSPSAEHASTEARQWVSLPEDGDMVREDHLKILKEIIRDFHPAGE